MFNLRDILFVLITGAFLSCAQKSKLEQASQSPVEMKICRINDLQDYKDFPSCFSGKNPDGSLTVRTDILPQLDFKNIDKRIHYSDFSRSQPKSAVHSSSVVGYILPNGKARDVVFFDNGPDYFEEGVARFISPEGKTGYINQDLQVVIPAVHDFASPFHEGKAYFCDGCKSVSEGEHQKIIDGNWGEMAKNGKTLRGPMPYKKFFNIKK